MKKITTTLIAAVTILLSFTGCDKYHRDRYTGNWEFVTERIYYNGSWSDIVEIKRDTVYYTGKITPGNLENFLFIKYTEEDETLMWIDKDAYIYHESNGPGPGSTGKFESKNNLRLTLLWGGYVPFEGDTDQRHDYIKGTRKGRKEK